MYLSGTHLQGNSKALGNLSGILADKVQANNLHRIARWQKVLRIWYLMDASTLRLVTVKYKVKKKKKKNHLVVLALIADQLRQTVGFHKNFRLIVEAFFVFRQIFAYANKWRCEKVSLKVFLGDRSRG